MKSFNGGLGELPLMGGVVQAQRRSVPAEVIVQLKDFRHACRLAWKLRVLPSLNYSQLAIVAGLYASHVSDYFSLAANRRMLPADKVADVELVLGNTVISQYLAHKSGLTVLEQLQAQRLRRTTDRRAA